MASPKWTCNAVSSVASATWDEYAVRYAGLLASITDGLGGQIAWFSDRVLRDGTQVDLDDVDAFSRMLVDSQLRNSRDGIMAGGGSHPVVFGERTVLRGSSWVVLRATFGSDERPALAHLEVVEPPGYSLWSYPDESLADLVGRIMASIDAHEARILDGEVLRLLAKAKATIVGSHNYVPGPLDATRFPPGARQGPCGSGYLLIVPPGPTPEDTLERMRWVAAATGRA